MALATGAVAERARPRRPAHALRRRGPRRAGAPAARRADVVVSLAQHHPAAAGPQGRAGPDRLRPLRQARGRRLVLVRPPRRLDRAARRGARPARHRRSSCTTGAARSGCASRSSIRSASRGSSSSTPASAAARPPSETWLRFRDVVRELGGALDIGRLVEAGTAQGLADEVREAYDAPFPTPESKAGALAFPELVPTEPDHPNAAPMNRVREALATLGEAGTRRLGRGGHRLADPLRRAVRRADPGARGTAC